MKVVAFYFVKWMEHVYWNIHRTSLGTTWLCSCFLETLPCCLYKVADQGLGSHFTNISWIYDWNHWDFLVDPSIIVDDLIRLLFAHAMTAVTACAKLWPDMFIRLHIRASYFIRRGLWTHKPFVKWDLGYLASLQWLAWPAVFIFPIIKISVCSTLM